MARQSSRKKKQARQKRRQQVPQPVLWIFVAVAMAIFIYSAVDFDLTQDDAFISFRYAENLLNGHGLVFNIGERVEGYTNFLWVIILALFKGLFGLDYLGVSRAIGVGAGAGLFVLIYLLLRRHFSENLLILYAGIAALMLLNLSIAYWAIASLETVAFSFMVLSAIVAEYYRPRLTPALLIIASLLRPEGVIVFGVILLNRLIRDRSVPWLYASLYVVPLIPFAVFKITYYGSLFPNPYFAKSGVGIEYILSGLEYTWQFVRELGVYGILVIIPLIMIRYLWSRYSLLYLFVLIYTAYIIWVGGDVLKVYRFFVPVVSVLYFLFAVSVYELIRTIKLKAVTRNAVALLIVVFTALPAYWLSKDHVNTFHFFEVNIVRKMHFLGTMLSRHMGKDFSLAASTIGMISYRLMGHRVIDMLGLTDKYIARNPEKVEGIQSTWKERRFNNEYLLSQQPDFVMFSTGYKPSAPAEKALMLHSEFRDNYRTIGFPRETQYKVLWRRVSDIDMERDSVLQDPMFSQRLADGLYALNRKTAQEAVDYFYEAWDILGDEYLLIDYFLGGSYTKAGAADSMLYYYDRCLDIYPDMWEVHLQLYSYYRNQGDSLKANLHVNQLAVKHPWLFDTNYRTYNPDVDFDYTP